MGFFFERLIKLTEAAPEDDAPQQDENQTTTDYTAEDTSATDDAENNTNQEENQDDNSDTPQDDNQEGNQDPNDDETTDYTDEGGDDFGDDGSESDDSGSGGSSDDSSDEEPVDDIKQQEEEMYSNLTAEELDIKHRELKNQFLAMFDIISSLVERIGDTSIPEDSIPAVEYVSKTLIQLKDMVTDYVNSVYQTKSYIENSINYNKFLAVLNGVNKILEEINDKKD